MSWVRRGYQAGVSGIPQVSEDLDLVSVLSLWTFAKVSDHTKASCHLPYTCRLLRFVHEILQLKLDRVACHLNYVWRCKS